MLDFDAYIFDCDGVILDSNKIKGNAFKHVLKEFPDQCTDKFLKYHYDNGGLSRYLKFKFFFEEIYKVDDIDKCIQEYSYKFSKIVKKELIDSPLVPGILNFLKLLDENNKPCYVNSGSEQNELQEVLLKKNLINYFKLILGSPNSKFENNEIIFNHLNDFERVVFFGDSRNDFVAAKNFNIDFVFVSEFSEWNNPNENFFKTIQNFSDLT